MRVVVPAAPGESKGDRGRREILHFVRRLTSFRMTLSCSRAGVQPQREEEIPSPALRAASPRGRGVRNPLPLGEGGGEGKSGE